MVKKIPINDDEQNQNITDSNSEKNEKQQHENQQSAKKQGNQKEKKQQAQAEHKNDDKKSKSSHSHKQQDKNVCQELEKKYEELDKKYNELNDRYLRLMAEYDNYRKRTLREKSDLIKTAAEKVLVDLLPVVDDFERALEHIDSANDIEALKEGVHLIYKRFQDFLTKEGVEEIEALGQPLDTDLHEAVQRVPAQDEDQKGKIVHVVQKGYKLNDKVIRHAKVVVAM